MLVYQSMLMRAAKDAWAGTVGLYILTFFQGNEHWAKTLQQRPAPAQPNTSAVVKVSGTPNHTDQFKRGFVPK